MAYFCSIHPRKLNHDGRYVICERSTYLSKFNKIMLTCNLIIYYTLHFNGILLHVDIINLHVDIFFLFYAEGRKCHHKKQIRQITGLIFLISLNVNKLCTELFLHSLCTSYISKSRKYFDKWITVIAIFFLRSPRGPFKLM